MTKSTKQKKRRTQSPKMQFTPITNSGDMSKSGHTATLGPIPQEARNAPVEWADKLIESLAPEAAMELKWQLLFGTDTMRATIAKDVLAMKGLSAKKDQVGNVPAVIHLHMGDRPNPFVKRVVDGAARQLDDGSDAVTVNETDTIDAMGGAK